MTAVRGKSPRIIGRSVCDDRRGGGSQITKQWTASQVKSGSVEVAAGFRIDPSPARQVSRKKRGGQLKPSIVVTAPKANKLPPPRCIESLPHPLHEPRNYRPGRGLGILGKRRERKSPVRQRAGNGTINVQDQSVRPGWH